MAVACAAAELLAHRALGVDLVLLVEGEEEAGSGGFVETVKRHKAQQYPLIVDEDLIDRCRRQSDQLIPSS